MAREEVEKVALQRKRIIVATLTLNNRSDHFVYLIGLSVRKNLF